MEMQIKICEICGLMK